MKCNELKKHMIVQLVNKDPEITDPPTNVIVLEVTAKDIKHGCQADMAKKELNSLLDSFPVKSVSYECRS